MTLLFITADQTTNQQRVRPSKMAEGKEKTDAKQTVSKKPAFKARPSRLDSFEIISETNPYRGLISLANCIFG